MHPLTNKAIDFLKTYESFRRFDFAAGLRHLDLIFLCGKAMPEDPNEPHSRGIIEQRCYSTGKQYVLYSEKIISQLSPVNLDLLTLEEVMFDLCSALVVVVESFGSACELGAFSLMNNNVSKIFIIYDKRYIATPSFLLLGPVHKVESVSKSHVIYESFFDSPFKTINLSTAGQKALRSISQTSFRRKPLSIDKSTGWVNDLGFFIRLLFDYVHTFGILVKDDIQYVLPYLFKKPVTHFRIRLSSKNTIGETESTRLLFLLPEIFCSLGIFEKKKNHGTEYYKINYASYIKKGLSSFKITSTLFRTSTTKRTEIRRNLSKILNATSRKGFELW